MKEKVGFLTSAACLKSSYTHNLYWLCFSSSWPGGGMASSHALAEDSVPKCQSTCCRHYENWSLFTYYGELRSRGSVYHLNVLCVLSSGTLWVDKEKQNLNLHKRAIRGQKGAHMCRLFRGLRVVLCVCTFMLCGWPVWLDCGAAL